MLRSGPANRLSRRGAFCRVCSCSRGRLSSGDPQGRVSLTAPVALSDESLDPK